MPKYTERRGNVFWFKRRAPKPLQAGTPLQLDDQSTAVGKNGYVKFSLRTSDAREASILARKYAHLLDEAAKGTSSPKQVRQGLNVVASKRRQPILVEAAELSRDEIQRSADLMYATLLAADEQTYEEGVRELTAEDAFAADDEDGDDVREPDRYQWSSANLPPATMKGQVQLLKQLMPALNFYLAQVTNKVAATPAAELLPFADAFRRFVDAMEKRRQSVHVPTPEPPAAPETPEPSFTLSVLYEKFKTYKIASKAWKDPKTQDSREYGPLVREFIEVVGDKDVRTLTLKDGEKYFEHTMRRQDIELGTKKRNFSRIKALLNYGGLKHGIPTITGPMEIEATYKKTHNSYQRFTPEDLKRLFYSESYRKHTFDKASQFWLPILGLYTGARIEELASLPVDKICEIDGVWCYFLSSNDANLGGKNQFAPRWVPIHPSVLQTGFLEHWRTVRDEGHTRLFPELGDAQRDGPGKRATVDFTEYRRSVGVGALEGRSTKVFHSFRSTLVSELIRRKTDDYLRHKLLGHGDGKDDAKFKGVHYDVYDQSGFEAKRAFKLLSKADFGLTHPKFEDTESMKAARARCLRKAQRADVKKLKVLKARSATA